MKKKINETLPIVLTLSGLFVLVNLSSNSEILCASLLLSSFYFFGLLLLINFFLAAHFLTGASWWQRLTGLMIRLSEWLVYPSIVLLLFLLTGIREIYPWSDQSLYQALNPSKKVMLSQPWFSIRIALIIAVILSLTSYFLRSIRYCYDDPSIINIRIAKKAAALVLVITVIGIFLLSNDLLSSLRLTFHSTISGWYTFFSLFAGGLSLLTLFASLSQTFNLGITVKAKQLLFLSKYLLATSIFWVYLWYSQYLIVWYGNIPEEKLFFTDRIDFQVVLFWSNIVLNLIIPMILLLTKKNKTNPKLVFAAALSVFIGHWLDFYLLIIPEIAPFSITTFILLLEVLGITSVLILVQLVKHRAKSLDVEVDDFEELLA